VELYDLGRVRQEMEQARTRKRFDYLECFLMTDRTTFIDVLAKARLRVYDIDIPTL
jgi:hypothetical protein